MNITLKRFIAREGLIIMSIVLLLGLTLFISHNVNRTKDKIGEIKLYTIKITDGQNRVLQIPAGNEATLESSVDDILANKKQEDAQTYIDKKWSADKERFNKRSQLNSVSKIVDIIIWVMIVTYPIYWALRFIIWAVRTLKT